MTISRSVIVIIRIRIIYFGVFFLLPTCGGIRRMSYDERILVFECERSPKCQYTEAAASLFRGSTPWLSRCHWV